MLAIEGTGSKIGDTEVSEHSLIRRFKRSREDESPRCHFGSCIALKEDNTVDTFLDELASRTPTPGGGAASALAGALGAALGAMSAAYTTGSEKYKHVEPQARRIIDRIESQRRDLQGLVKRDADAYAMWVEARKLPKDTADQKAARKAKLAEAREEATQVPETILAAANTSLQLNAELVEICNPNLIADVAVSAQLLEACALGACTQILGNLAPEDGNPESTRRGEAARRSRKACRELSSSIQKRVFEVMGVKDDT